jgi:DNA-binding response OmpR family regulator
MKLMNASNQAEAAAQRLVVVNGSSEILELVESVLDPGHYDVVFAETADHPYSLIRRLQPNMVILCVRIEDLEGFQILSMLKVDEETRRIPVLTYTTEFEGQDVEGRLLEPSDDERLFLKPSLPMN